MAKQKKKNKTVKNVAKQVDEKEEFIDVEKLTDKEEQFVLMRKTGFSPFTSVISILLGGLCVPIVLALMALIVLSLIGLSHEEIYDMPIVYCLYSSMSILGYGLYVFIAIK